MHYFALIVDDQYPTEKRIEELMYPYYELECGFEKKDMKKDPRCEFVPKYSQKIAQALMVIIIEDMNGDFWLMGQVRGVRLLPSETTIRSKPLSPECLRWLVLGS